MTMTRHDVEGCNVEACFACKCATMQFSPAAATASQVGEQKKFEKQRIKDSEAYWRLRKDGLQPKASKGAAELESRAASRWEAQTGQNLNGNAKLGAKLDEMQAAVNKGEVID